MGGLLYSWIKEQMFLTSQHMVFSGFHFNNASRTIFFHGTLNERVHTHTHTHTRDSIYIFNEKNTNLYEENTQVEFLVELDFKHTL